MSSESVRVNIFGTDFNLSCEADAETTKRVAQYVNTKIAELQEFTGLRDDLKIVILAALNIAGELFDAKAMYEAEAKKLVDCEEKLKSINDMISSMKKVS